MNTAPAPRGPHASSVITGLTCAIAVALALWAQTHGGDLPGRHTLLVGLGGLGAFMLVVAAVGLLTQRAGSGS